MNRLLLDGAAMTQAHRRYRQLRAIGNVLLSLAILALIVGVLIEGPP